MGPASAGRPPFDTCILGSAEYAGAGAGVTDDTSPYPRLAVIETLTWRDTVPYRYTEIALVTLNGRYSYTLRFQWRTHGRGYQPFLKFCDPYPTKEDALVAAIADLKRADPPPEVQTWIHDLTAPKQLSLF